MQQVVAQLSTDLIYSKPISDIQDFRFDNDVVSVFPDMIKRSVPGYSTIIDNIGMLAQQFVRDDSNIYDLGCSLGAASLSMRKYIDDKKGVKIIAIDNSPEMIDRCRSHLAAFKSAIPVDVMEGDINHIDINNASVVVLNFTLQFIAPELRRSILDKIYAGLNDGGILVLSEKVSLGHSTGDESVIELHHEFKRRNGYSELEISQKRSALENVMKLESLPFHLTRLKDVGFTEALTWFQCFNFASMLAIKK